jgi:hypothetical protein
MAIAYRIYSNGGSGGPVDYSAPVASTAGLTYTTGQLGLSTDTTFVVRAYDTVAGLEEANTDACVRVVVSAQGVDASGLPNPPHALSLSPVPQGGCRLSWAYAPAAPAGVPTGFRVYLTRGNAVDFGSPVATASYTPGKVGYSVTLAGPLDVSIYTAAVSSVNATGEGGASGAVSCALGLPAVPFVMDPVTAGGL